MRPTRRKVASLVFLLSGCPAVAPTPSRIERVEVVGDPSSQEFMLRITGRGLAPGDLSYDLSKGTGLATTSVRLEVFDSSEVVHVVVPRPLLEVLSPRRIEARVIGARLSPNSYGVRIYGDESEAPLVERTEAFRVELGPATDPSGDPDGGRLLPAEDAAEIRDAPPTDAFAQDAGDADAPFAPADAAPGQDAAPLDGGIGSPDAGPTDVEGPPDSGLGPFQGAFAFRQRVTAVNGLGVVAPAGTSIRLAIPHATLVAAASAKADATDVGLYLGATPLLRQWDDFTKLGSDDLVMIAKLPADLAFPGSPGDPELILYYGDPSATIAPTDAVYELIERFQAAVSSGWATNGWFACDFDRPLEANTAPGAGSAYCGTDSPSNPTRRTLATPNVPAITSGIAANQVYEMSVWSAGRMISQTNDLFYFALGPNNAEYVDTQLIPAAGYIDFSPNVLAFAFPERDGSTRVLDGWRFPSTFQWWTRIRARFRPPADAPSLHFRLLSKDGADNAATGVVLDDFSVRLALEPELDLQLGPVESR